MISASALIGELIIGSCVKYEGLDTKDNLLNRAVRVRLNHKSNRRVGRISEAYVEREIKKVEGNEIYYSNSHITKDVCAKLKERYKTDFQINQKPIIKGNQLFGECEKLGRITQIPRFSASHGGHRVPMEGSKENFSLCYINLWAETEFIKL